MSPRRRTEAAIAKKAIARTGKKHARMCTGGKSHSYTSCEAAIHPAAHQLRDRKARAEGELCAQGKELCDAEQGKRRELPAREIVCPHLLRDLDLFVQCANQWRGRERDERGERRGRQGSITWNPCWWHAALLLLVSLFICACIKDCDLCPCFPLFHHKLRYVYSVASPHILNA